MQTLYVVQYMSLNAVQSAAEQRQTAQCGCQTSKTATIPLCSQLLQRQNKLSYREIQNVTMYSTHHYNLLNIFFLFFFLFESESPAAKRRRGILFGIKASGCKATEWGCRYLSPDKLISSGLYSAWFSSGGSTRFY